MISLLHNEIFWLILAWMVLIALFGKKIYAALNNFISSGIKDIESSISESSNLYSKSVTELNNQKEKYIRLEESIESSKKQHDKEIDTIYQVKLNNLVNKLDNNSNKFNIYSTNITNKANQKIRENLVEASIQEVKNTCKDKISQDEHHKLIEESINNLAKTLKV